MIIRRLCVLSQCLAAGTLAAHGLSEKSRLDGLGLQEFCPTMLQQLDSRVCQDEQNQEPEPSAKPSNAEGKREDKRRQLFKTSC